MNKVIILSGVSGSGKSTHAKKIIRESIKSPGWQYRIVSADDFFMVDGEYQFDVSKLSEAHGSCFKKFILAMQDEVELIIVDNTNTTTEEIAPYILGADAFGYESEIITILVGLEGALLRECAKRNRHGVPLRSIENQAQNLYARKMMPWWKNTKVQKG